MTRTRYAASIACISAGMFLFASTGFADPKSGPSGKVEASISREVRHELSSLGLYTVFDDLKYQVNGNTVVLSGKVVNPVLKDDAAKAVKDIEGVQKVENKIEVLPVSPMDNAIRRAVFRAIYGDPGLERYALQAIPSIHIIVENGSITLEGAVATEMDKQVAGVRANSVPGTFRVTNNLQIHS